jgi:hypothetical protein
MDCSAMGRNGAAQFFPQWGSIPSTEAQVKHALLHKDDFSDTLGVVFFTSAEASEKCRESGTARAPGEASDRQSAFTRSTDNLRCGLVQYTTGRAAGLLPPGARVVVVDGLTQSAPRTKRARSSSRRAATSPSAISRRSPASTGRRRSSLPTSAAATWLRLRALVSPQRPLHTTTTRTTPCASPSRR